MNLEKRWHQLTRQFSLGEEISAKMYAQITQRYLETHRYYHNLEHLQELFTLADENSDLIEEKVLLELAIWYHDVIYSVWFPAKNEKKSADFALQHSEVLDLPKESKARLYSWIVGTKAHTLTEEHNTLTGRLFMDFDMAILAAPREKYQLYCESIRKEYSVYPSFLYNAGRKKALLHFLATDSIFLTDIFRNQYEKLARANLQYELDGLL